MRKTEFLIPYPRRQFIRWLLRAGIRLLFPLVCKVEIIGRENMPAKGPLLVVGNHFNFLDVVAWIHASDCPLEFIGGAANPNAPKSLSWLGKAWGVLPVYRGSVSRGALLGSQQVLKQDGILGIYPEGGSWAAVLRPARPGAAFLATCCNAPILPVGCDGLVDVFPMLVKGRRAKVTIRFGELFGPFYISERGVNDRQKLDEIGHVIMRKIAELIPPERRGYYSDDPAIREAARGSEVYPWADQQQAIG
jgi:1-acyl-sn-glycerol-3-phosphate acyltransferase